jgi:hypothetical protein
MASILRKNVFDEPEPDWLELWAGPFHFRATFDKGSFGPGHSLEQINGYGQKESEHGGLRDRLYSVWLDQSDGATVIEWWLGRDESEGPLTTVRYYNFEIEPRFAERLRENSQELNSHLHFVPPEQRMRATGAYAIAFSIRHWAEREFFHAVCAGQCQIWARVGSRTAPFSRIPSDIFSAYQIESWGRGQIGGASATLGGEPTLYSIRVSAPQEFGSENGAERVEPVSSPLRRGRAKGTGFQKADAGILEKMKQAIDADPALNATSAARKFANEAPGASYDAKVDRLSRAYREKWGT